MTMLQMLPKVIGTKELLCLITFAEFVDVIEMFGTHVPVGGIGKLLTAVATNVDGCRTNGRRMEGRLDASKRGACPRMTSKM